MKIFILFVSAILCLISYFLYEELAVREFDASKFTNTEEQPKEESTEEQLKQQEKKLADLEKKILGYGQKRNEDNPKVIREKVEIIDIPQAKRKFINNEKYTTNTYQFLQDSQVKNYLLNEIIDRDTFVCGAKAKPSLRSKLEKLFKDKKAAGNFLDRYINMDNGHALVNLKMHPQLKKITKFEETKIYNVVVGNASLGVKGMWSLPRFTKMNNQINASKAYDQYRKNMFFWYPGVRDISPFSEKSPDLSIAMIPYVGMSYGKSRTELDEMSKLIYALASFKPDVKMRLIENGLVIPTYQMILRRALVNNDSEYLSYKAHPTVFRDIDNVEKMIDLANAIDITNIPPLIQLEVEKETFLDNHNSHQFMDIGTTEKLFDTPCSIARVFRGFDYTKSIVINLEKSFDCNNKALKFDIKVLRGKDEHVRLTPLNSEGTRIKIDIDYPASDVVKGSERTSPLVIVGFFANNGTFYSAPGFLSVLMLPNEEREYDGQKRLKKLTTLNTSVEPNISKLKKVIKYEEFKINSSSKLMERTRHFKNKKSLLLSEEGYEIVKKDEYYRPIKAIVNLEGYDKSDQVRLGHGKAVMYHYLDLNKYDDSTLDFHLNKNMKVLKFPKNGDLKIDLYSNRLIYISQNKNEDFCTVLEEGEVYNLYKLTISD